MTVLGLFRILLTLGHSQRRRNQPVMVYDEGLPLAWRVIHLSAACLSLAHIRRINRMNLKICPVRLRSG